MYTDIIKRINNNEYEAAMELIHTMKPTLGVYDDTLAILEAEVCYHLGDKPGMFTAIKNGLHFNPTNYELFFSLGNYYANTNLYQSYLCYEQAEFYCSNPDDIDFISNAKQELISSGITVPNLSIVILSYNAYEEMKLCLESLKKHCPSSYEIIIIDNHSTEAEVIDYLKAQTGITLVCNQTNVGFPAGCNQGIRLSHPGNDIFLLNNDTIVFPNSLFWLRMGLYEYASVGATGSISNYVGNCQQLMAQFDSIEEYSTYIPFINIPMISPYEQKLRLIGFAMMLKRTALDTIGLLDERFSPGNYEDDDLSFRLVINGYTLLLCKNSFIYHYGGKNFGQNRVTYHKLLKTNAAKFNEKWGINWQYSCHERRDVAELISSEPTAEINVLEIGCALGATLGHIRNSYPASHVYGIELDPTTVFFAKHYIPDIIQGNIETMDLDCYPTNFFDYILFPDVLEHLHDPEKILIKMKKYLKPNGFILASIPNIMHYTVILDLLKGNFTYQDAGTLDKTHLRFFTLKEFHALLKRCGFQIDIIKASLYDPILSEGDKHLYDCILQLPGVAPQAQFESYQYLIKAHIM